MTREQYRNRIGHVAHRDIQKAVADDDVGGAVPAARHIDAAAVAVAAQILRDVVAAQILRDVIAHLGEGGERYYNYQAIEEIQQFAAERGIDLED